MSRLLTFCITAALAIQARAAVTETEATGIALDNAGLSGVAPRALYVGPDTLDGTLVYEVRFHCRGFRHVYIIEAATGRILNSERKRLPESERDGADRGSQTDIGGLRARAIAIDDAGAGATATAVFVDRGYRNGSFFYVITFRAGEILHRYRIDAADGTVLSRSTDDN